MEKYTSHSDLSTNIVTKNIQLDLIMFEDDNFKYLKKIGNGNFSEVFLVKAKKDNNLYAIKKINKINILIKNNITSVFEELRMLKLFKNNKFVIDIKFILQDKKHIYFGMEYNPFGTLRTLLKNKFTLTKKEAAWVLMNLCVILESLENYDIVHRDIKPENIMVMPDGYLKLIDFGISKVIKNNDDLEQLDKSGTTCYMAPETLLYGQSKSNTDYFSIGIILYEMLLGNVYLIVETI